MSKQSIIHLSLSYNSYYIACVLASEEPSGVSVGQLETPASGRAGRLLSPALDPLQECVILFQRRFPQTTAR